RHRRTRTRGSKSAAIPGVHDRGAPPTASGRLRRSGPVSAPRSRVLPKVSGPPGGRSHEETAVFEGFNQAFVKDAITRSSANPMDRRRFLKAAGITTAGVAGVGAFGLAAGTASAG